MDASLENKTTVKGERHTYRIEQVLGQGGFGITYRASAREGRTVFLYALKEHFIKDVFDRNADGSIRYSQSAAPRVEEAKRDFVTEARRLMRLGGKNNNIVRVEETFECNNTAYYAMEYLDGDNLRRKVLKDGVMTEAAMLRLMRPVLLAVQYLHNNQILHLDIKPDNIVLRLEDDGSETPVLIDFGVSMHFDKEGNPTTSSRFAGGTIGFAPLEQAQGIPSFTPSPDVYALGATMYFLLTGKDPEQASFNTDVHVNNYLRSLGVGDTVRQAIVHAMRPNPMDRTPTAKQLLQELEAVAAPPAASKKADSVGPSPQESGASAQNLVGGPPTDPMLGLPTDPKNKKKTPQNRSKNKRKDGVNPHPRSNPHPRPKKWWLLGVIAVLILGLVVIIDRCSNDEPAYDEEIDTMPEEVVIESPLTFTVNGVDFDMVWVDGGTFTMGCTSGRDNSELLAHKVTLDDYYIGETEVTQALWTAVMGTSVRQQRDLGDSSLDLRGVGSNYPMYYVNYDEAVQFARKLSQLTGRTFSLPTEAEWEYAARGGSKSRGYKFAGSNDIEAVAWYAHNSGWRTHPVAQKAANELGLYDMSGNVWEWCSDWYGDYSSGAQRNPTGPGSGTYRVLRGGCWGSISKYCRVSFRDIFGVPAGRDDLNGFRLVLCP